MINKEMLLCSLFHETSLCSLFWIILAAAQFSQTVFVLLLYSAK